MSICFTEASKRPVSAIKISDSILCELAWLGNTPAKQQVKPDDHSEVVPLLPIPNRTVKRLSANDSAGSRVKVGHRQAINVKRPSSAGPFFYFRILSDYSAMQ
jgi:hypothetical protein